VSTRTPGSAGSGTVEWLWQRLSAVYLGGFGLLELVYLLFHPVHDYASWRQLFHQPVLRVLWLLGFVALLAHAWIGMRSVYLDYLHAFWLRFAVTMVSAIALFACGVWLALILFRGVA
jgi:succinate dehydrogenase / fumarate reductase membrane anchor subunit